MNQEERARFRRSLREAASMTEGEIREVEALREENTGSIEDRMRAIVARCHAAFQPQERKVS